MVHMWLYSKLRWKVWMHCLGICFTIHNHLTLSLVGNCVRFQSIHLNLWRPNQVRSLFCSLLLRCWDWIFSHTSRLLLYYCFQLPSSMNISSLSWRLEKHYYVQFHSLKKILRHSILVLIGLIEQYFPILSFGFSTWAKIVPWAKS